MESVNFIEKEILLQSTDLNRRIKEYSNIRHFSWPNKKCVTTIVRPMECLLFLCNTQVFLYHLNLWTLWLQLIHLPSCTPSHTHTYRLVYLLIFIERPKISEQIENSKNRWSMRVENDRIYNEMHKTKRERQQQKWKAGWLSKRGEREWEGVHIREQLALVCSAQCPTYVYSLTLTLAHTLACGMSLVTSTTHCRRMQLHKGHKATGQKWAWLVAAGCWLVAAGFAIKVKSNFRRLKVMPKRCRKAETMHQQWKLERDQQKSPGKIFCHVINAASGQLLQPPSPSSPRWWYSICLSVS